jgi:hypothetical protein
MHRFSLRTLLRPFAGAAFATVAVASAAGAASPAAFSDPSLLIAGGYVDIDAARDGSGKLHIAAETVKGSIVYITDRSGSVTTRVVAKVVTGDHRYGEPTIALDGKGRVHIAFTRAGDGGFDCGFCPEGVMMVSDRGRPAGTFPNPVMVGKFGSYAPDLAIRSGKRYLAYLTGLTGLEADPGTLWMQTDASGAWTTKKAAGGIMALGQLAPSIAVTSGGLARIAFEDGGIKVASAATKIGSFSVETVTGTNESDRAPIVIMNPSDAPIVLFRSDRAGTADDGIKLRVKSGATWSGVKVTPRLGAFEAAISSGTIVVTVGGTTTGTAGVWSYEGPSFPEETIASVRVKDVALAGTIHLLFARPSTPKGIYLAID